MVVAALHFVFVVCVRNIRLPQARDEAIVTGHVDLNVIHFKSAMLQRDQWQFGGSIQHAVTITESNSTGTTVCEE